jgi:hypothetical protein
MKKLLTILLLLGALFLPSCADSKKIDGVTYRPYGLLNENLHRNDSIEYQVSPWAVASGIIFCELIVPPIYTFGYNLYEPIGKKSDFKNPHTKGIVK